MKKIVIWSLVVFGFGCGEEAPYAEKTTPKEDKVMAKYSLDFQEYADSELGCEGEGCTEVEIVLLILRGGDSIVAAEINSMVEARFRQMIKARLPEPRSTGTWESLAASFIEGYELFEQEFPEDATAWYLYLKGRESFLMGDSILTVIVEDSEFMGGAHGNSATLIESYDLADGVRIDFIDRYGERLKVLAEAKFRSRYDVPEDQDLNDAGFIFPEEGFILPENIGYSKDGLMLVYNPYEVAPYSKGTTVLTIPFAELDPEKGSI